MLPKKKLGALRRALGHEDMLFYWIGLFFLFLGLLLDLRGVKEFSYAGRSPDKPQTGEPAMLYWIGGLTCLLATVRLVLFRRDRAKTAAAARRKEVRRRRRGARRPH